MILLARIQSYISLGGGDAGKYINITNTIEHKLI